MTPGSNDASIAIVLCGGSGHRLGAVSLHTPKCLLEVNSVPLLEIHISLFRTIGVKSIILTTGHLGSKIRQWVEKRRFPIDIYFCDSFGKGTAGSIMEAISLIPPRHHNFWVSMADVFCYPNLVAMHQFAVQTQAQGVILGTPVPDASAYGTIVFDDTCRVLSFHEKLPSSNAAVVDAGFYLFNRDCFVERGSDSPRSLERDVLPYLKDLYVLIHKGVWMDIYDVIIKCWSQAHELIERERSPGRKWETYMRDFEYLHDRAKKYAFRKKLKISEVHPSAPTSP
ncbi:MAG: nucleotidyltransferase family protein [Phycisphaerae bacterium]|nr:nucleotidyltransferase family protein [Phycisphaerae bacterium]